MIAVCVPLTAERRELAADHLALAKSIAGPFGTRRPKLRDEYFSAAYLALVHAAGSFDAARGVRFATWAYRRIEGAMLDVGRGLEPLGLRRAPDRSLNPEVVSVGRCRPDSIHVYGMTPDPPVGEAVEDADDLQRWLRLLPPRHREVCRRHAYGESQAEIARAVGLDFRRVFRLLAESRDILAPEPSLS